jgi:hypothetical protein
VVTSDSNGGETITPRAGTHFDSGAIAGSPIDPDGWGQQNSGLSGATTVVTSDSNGGETITPRAGTHFAKFYLQKSDWPRPPPYDDDKPRAQLIKNLADMRINPLEEWWMGFSFYIPLNYVEETNGTNGETYFQIHGTNGGNASPPLCLYYKYGKLSFHYRAGKHPNATASGAGTWLEGELYEFPTVPKGRWVDVVIQVKFAHDNQGFQRVWVDGDLKGERINVPTLYWGLNGFGPNNTDPLYALLSLYKAKFANSTTNKTDSTIYYDEVRYAKGSGGYQVVDPGEYA